jgi:aminoglycoside phosphotransferase (APT) family kinase protein
LDKLGNSFYAVGRWLKTFHRTAAIDLGAFDVPEDLVEYVDIRLMKLVKWEKIEQRQYREILCYFEQQLEAGISLETEMCGVHRDLSLSNILIDQNNITVLDFAMYCLGSPYIDVSYFYQRLGNLLTNPAFRPQTIHFFQRKFLEGYQSNFNLYHSLFLTYRARHMINRLISLVEMENSGLIRQLYQYWQYNKCLRELTRLIRLQRD